MGSEKYMVKAGWGFGWDDPPNFLTTCSKINQVVPYLNENYAEFG